MARCRQELGLGNIGGVCLALGMLECGIEPGQFFRALAHAAFQCLVRSLQRFRRLDARRDVGESGCNAAVGHAG